MVRDSDVAAYLARHARGERLIAGGRVILLAVALVAGSLDGGSSGSSLATAILSIALAYAIGVAVLVWRADAAPERGAIWLHAIDLVLFSAIYATHGSASPFYLYYVFLLLSAALRWHAAGVVRTGVVAGLAFVAIGVYDVVGRDPLFDLPQFVIRLGYFSVATMLLAYLAQYQHGLFVDLARLATWPDPAADDERTFLSEALRHVSWTLNVPRSVLLIEDQEEPWVHLTLWSAGGVQSNREPALSLDAVVDRALVDASFFCADVGAPVNHVVYRSRHGVQRWRGALLNPALRSRLEVNRLLSCRLTSKSVRGRVFFVDGARPSLDELLFAEVVTDMLSIRLDRYYLARRLRERAVSDERGRFSRDLHDGLLQSLTAWGLQIGEVARRLQDADAAVAHRLHDIRRQMAGDQRELRSFIGRLQSDGTAEPVDFSLIGRLHDLRDRFADEWGLTVEVDFSGLHALIPPALRAEVCRIVHEALANAARHAHTSLVRVQVAATDDDVFLSVEDRGCGFPFKGRYDLATLRAQRRGPTSLIDRVADLGGELVLESSDSGSRLDIVIPCNAVRPARAEDAS